MSCEAKRMTMISELEFERLTEEIFRFHTKRAPGIPIAIAMVDLGRTALGNVPGRLNVISESQACISDVIQVMTGCTIGNRYLKFLKDLGRYAMTLYDRDSGLGVRVYVDLAKIAPEKTPELYKFFRRERGEEVERGGEAREASGRRIIEEFRSIGRDIFGLQRVRVLACGKPPMLPARICPGCGESFLQRDAAHQTCDVCAGPDRYFELLPS